MTSALSRPRKTARAIGNNRHEGPALTDGARLAHAMADLVPAFPASRMAQGEYRGVRPSSPHIVLDAPGRDRRPAYAIAQALPLVRPSDRIGVQQPARNDILLRRLTAEPARSDTAEETPTFTDRFSFPVEMEQGGRAPSSSRVRTRLLQAARSRRAPSRIYRRERAPSRSRSNEIGAGEIDAAMASCAKA